jgi:hypothetical protein
MAVLIMNLLGCERDLGTDVPSLSVPTLIELRVGQSFRVAGTSPVEITFDGVIQDSRCPIGAMCFWEGDGEARLTIRPFVSNALDCTLHTTLDPKIFAAAGITVHLKNLAPYPKVDVWINRWEYVVTLEIRAPSERRRNVDSPAEWLFRGLPPPSSDRPLMKLLSRGKV